MRLTSVQRRILNESFKGQTYSFGTGVEYSVPKLYQLAKNKQTFAELVDVPLNELMHNLEGDDTMETDEEIGSEKFSQRANRADLAYPILIHEINGEKWIIDGAHRLYKAHKAGLPSIKAYVFYKIPDATAIRKRI